MMRLFKVELKRAIHRRANRVLVLIAVALFITVGVVGSIKVHDLPPIRTITAADGLVHLSNPDFVGTVHIVGNQAHFSRQFSVNSRRGPVSAPPDTFTEVMEPGEKILVEGKPGHQNVVEDFPSESLARFTDMFNHGNPGNSNLNVPAMLLFFASLLAGATMVGADWKWNTYGTMLTWEPRRLRLITARFAACFLLCFVATIVLSLFFVLCVLPTIWLHGSFAGADSQWWIFALQALLRVAILAGLGGVGGGALAMIGRNTVAALIVSAVWLLILEEILLQLRPNWWEFAFGQLVRVIIAWQGTNVRAKIVGPGGACASVAVLMVVLVAAAVISFTQRDVTAS